MGGGEDSSTVINTTMEANTRLLPHHPWGQQSPGLVLLNRQKQLSVTHSSSGLQRHGDQFVILNAM